MKKIAYNVVSILLGLCMIAAGGYMLYLCGIATYVYFKEIRGTDTIFYPNFWMAYVGALSYVVAGFLKIPFPFIERRISHKKSFLIYFIILIVGFIFMRTGVLS